MEESPERSVDKSPLPTLMAMWPDQSCPTIAAEWIFRTHGRASAVARPTASVVSAPSAISPMIPPLPDTEFSLFNQRSMLLLPSLGQANLAKRRAKGAVELMRNTLRW